MSHKSVEMVIVLACSPSPHPLPSREGKVSRHDKSPPHGWGRASPREAGRGGGEKNRPKSFVRRNLEDQFRFCSVVRQERILLSLATERQNVLHRTRGTLAEGLSGDRALDAKHMTHGDRLEEKPLALYPVPCTLYLFLIDMKLISHNPQPETSNRES